MPYDNYDLLFADMKNEKIDLFFDTKQAVLDASNTSSVKTLFGLWYVILVIRFMHCNKSVVLQQGLSVRMERSFTTNLRRSEKRVMNRYKHLLFYFNLNASSLQQYFNEEEYAALNTKFNHLYLLRENIDALTIDIF